MRPENTRSSIIPRMPDSMRTKHLFLAYSWTFGHVGDVAITGGLLRLIQQQNPDLPVRVMAWQGAGHPEIDKARDYYPEYHKPTGVTPNYFRELIGSEAPADGAWSRFMKRWGEYTLGHFERGCVDVNTAIAIAGDLLERLPLEIHIELQERYPETLNLFKEARFVLFNSSTSLSFGRLGVRNLWNNTLRNAMPLLIARALKIPYGLCPQSVESVEWPVDLIYRPLFQEARFLYGRDSDSLRYLEQRNLGNTRSGFCPDTTFFFNRSDSVWCDSYMRKHGLQPGRFAILMVRIPISGEGSVDPVASAVSGDRLKRQMDKNVYLIEQWIRETGLKIVICHEGSDTIVSAREMWARLSDKARSLCVYMEEFWCTEQAFALYAQARIMISMEIHSAFLSLAAGTPVLHHPFAEAGRKMEAFRDLGLEDWLLDIDQISQEALLETALSLHQNHTQVRRRLTELKPKLDKRIMDIWSQVAEIY